MSDTNEDKPILSDLAVRILRRLKEANLNTFQLAAEFPASDDALMELIEAGFIAGMHQRPPVH